MRNTNQTCFPTTRSCCLTLLLLLLSGILRLSCPLTLQTAPVLDFNPPPHHLLALRDVHPLLLFPHSSCMIRCGDVVKSPSGSALGLQQELC